MREYLAFVDYIGMNNNDEFIYRFDFTENTDVVWGDYFNIAPAVIVPNLQPDVNCLSTRAKVVFHHDMMIAKNNSCFSMQDCIDGIIALMFSEIDEETLEIDGEPFCLNFGEEKESVIEKLKKINIELTDIEVVKNGDESAIDELIDTDILSGRNDDEDDNDEEDE